MNKEYFGDVSEKARTLIDRNGGKVEKDGGGFNVTVEADLVGSSDRGGWGNFSYRQWKLKVGALSWDSDDRELQVARWK